VILNLSFFFKYCRLAVVFSFYIAAAAAVVGVDFVLQTNVIVNLFS